MSETEVIEGVVVETGPTCTNCGAAVSSRGARSATGDRYCSSKAACRRARDRAAHRRRMGEVGVEDRPCSSCGDALPERTKRVTDSPLGRWCLKATCQAQRRRVTNPERFPRYREEYAAIVTARALLAVAEIEDCEVCGFERGRLGFMHPRPMDGSMCLNQGDEYPARMPMGYEEMFGPGGTHEHE